ncbi:hypothetical protein LFL96_30300 [Paraburkholderia sp. D15]|uniref:hypothetical protein n=1 Tax=Paraburkholderia sp. D15 TaxID=2880218 RepID=UPI00247A5D42|nr:hypothetical protein [Paraburkholderia sp. D15]WGS52481.1 hypothetical protein LFL96_30300 [Paraburkholderia sp. D15]
MRNGAVHHAVATESARQPARSPAWISERGLRWALGATIWIVAIGLIVVAALYAPDSTRANTRRCLEQVANEEHTSLDAFFQNPAQQDALAQAMTVCAR